MHHCDVMIDTGNSFRSSALGVMNPARYRCAMPANCVPDYRTESIYTGHLYSFQFFYTIYYQCILSFRTAHGSYPSASLFYSLFISPYPTHFPLAPQRVGGCIVCDTWLGVPVLVCEMLIRLCYIPIERLFSHFYGEDSWKFVFTGMMHALGNTQTARRVETRMKATGVKI